MPALHGSYDQDCAVVGSFGRNPVPDAIAPQATAAHLYAVGVLFPPTSSPSPRARKLENPSNTG